MLSELGFWSNAVKHAIPDAKFIEQDDITDLRDIIAHSTLPAFATDYTEQADHLPALKKTSRVAVIFNKKSVTFRCIQLAGQLHHLLNIKIYHTDI